MPIFHKNTHLKNFDGDLATSSTGKGRLADGSCTYDSVTDGGGSGRPIWSSLPGSFQPPSGRVSGSLL